MIEPLFAIRLHDWLVGGVAMVIGIATIVAAVANAEILFLIPKVERLELRFGRRPTRWICVIVGFLCMAFGVLVASGKGL